MKFAKPVLESGTMIMYSTFPEILKIDHSNDDCDDSLVKASVQKTPKEERIIYPTFLSPEEEGHVALGRDATFLWYRALTHPLRCNRTRHKQVLGLTVAIWDRTS